MAQFKITILPMNFTSLIPFSYLNNFVSLLNYRLQLINSYLSICYDVFHLILKGIHSKTEIEFILFVLLYSCLFKRISWKIISLQTKLIRRSSIQQWITLTDFTIDELLRWSSYWILWNWFMKNLSFSISIYKCFAGIIIDSTIS